MKKDGEGGEGGGKHTTRNEDVEEKVVWYIARIEHKV